MYIDTNIILRAILNDHKELSAKAQKFFKSAVKTKASLYTIDLVIGELFWVMESKEINPKMQRQQIADLIISFVNLVNLKFPSEDIFTQAADIYKKTTLDITDILLYLKAKQSNKPLKTFDKKLEKFRG